MAKLTDMQIKAWIKAGERFEGRADGDGLWLRFREADKVPVWRYRYRFEGKQRTMQIGSYAELSLAKARETARELAARVKALLRRAGDAGRPLVAVDPQHPTADGHRRKTRQVRELPLPPALKALSNRAVHQLTS